MKADVPLLVAICTHNPRLEVIRETLAALRTQTVDCHQWKLLIVDNASTVSLAEQLELSWHPSARVVREENLGTAHARLRALQEASRSGAELLLFVDDDTVLARDYIARGLAIAADWRELGCWGGQMLPRFETSPPDWIANYLKYLAIWKLERASWTNRVPASYDEVPPTAGCFIRSAVWKKFIELAEADPRRLTLGAKGKDQVRGEDIDLILTAIDIGLGIGRFPELALEHLIPRQRLTVDYIENLLAGTYLGTGLLEYLRYRRMPPPIGHGIGDRALLYWRAYRLPDPLRRFCLAEMRGRRRARAIVQGWQAESMPGRS